MLHYFATFHKLFEDSYETSGAVSDMSEVRSDE